MSNACRLQPLPRYRRYERKQIHAYKVIQSYSVQDINILEFRLVDIRLGSYRDRKLPHFDMLNLAALLKESEGRSIKTCHSVDGIRISLL